MLSASGFAKFIGASRELSGQKHQRHEVLGLKGAKRGLRFPKWQVTFNGVLLPELPELFDVRGGDSWTVYRFLTEDHPELEGNTALRRCSVVRSARVLVAAENTGGRFSTVDSFHASRCRSRSKLTYSSRSSASRASTIALARCISVCWFSR